MKIPEICELCQDLVKSRRQIVCGYGYDKAKIMFIGICPGNHMLKGGADLTGIPFLGDASGNVFEKLLGALDLARTDVYTTNLVKCRPASRDKLFNRPPTEAEISNCIRYLHEEITFIQPKIIICLGKIVEKYLKEGEPFTYIKLYHWHPAFIARSPEFFDVWANNIKHDIKKWTKKMYLQHYLEEYEK